MTGIKFFERDQIEAGVDEIAAMADICRAFVHLGKEEAQLAAVGYLEFSDPEGHSHIKSGHIGGEQFFVVKVVNGFPANALIGKAPEQGFMAVFDARTGAVAGLLLDNGYLTGLRTAMTGAIAADLICGEGRKTLGIVGTGVQAAMQIDLIRKHEDIDEVLLWGRNDERAQALARRAGAECVSREEMCARADLIVTTTSATAPVLRDAWIRPGARIIAVGADSRGKRELEPETLARARVVVDAPKQCIDEGEAGWAVRAGLIQPDALIELGQLIEQPRAFREEEIVIVDLTGTAVQDLAIASSVWRALISAEQGLA